MVTRDYLQFTALVVCLGMSGCDVILELREGHVRDCAVIAECPDSPDPCRIVSACNAGICVYNAIPDCQPNKVKALAAGWYHTCALMSNGVVKCWGRNDMGQLGLGDTDNHGDTPGEMGLSLPPVSLGVGKFATALSAGNFHTCVVLNDKTVKCWGLNGVGQLGLGTTENHGSGPNEMSDALKTVELGENHLVNGVTAGGYHSCALLDNKLIKCWGANASGQLGIGDDDPRGNKPGEMGVALPVANLSQDNHVTALALGTYFGCATLTDGIMKCWGSNQANQTGTLVDVAIGDEPVELGDFLPSVPLDASPLAIACGNEHTCVLRDSSRVMCWGGNTYGQVGAINGGNPTEVALSGKTGVMHLSAGYAHTCVVRQDGTVQCWGWNGFGQLGLGDTNNRGDQANELGDHLPNVQLVAGAKSVVAGFAHTCALLDSGQIQCWGQNSYGQLGAGDTKDRHNESTGGEPLRDVDLFGGSP